MSDGLIEQSLDRSEPPAFKWRELLSKNLLLVGGGIGIAPLVWLALLVGIYGGVRILPRILTL